jgi:uncharacterized protein
LRNLAIAYDMVDYAQMRYNLLGNGSHWFPGNQAKQVAHLDLKACLSQSPHHEKIPHLLADAHQRLAGAGRKRLSQS